MCVWMGKVCFQSTPQTGLTDYVRICTCGVRRQLYPRVRNAGQSLSIIYLACVNLC